ncbi:MAG TPA: hypothetical protein VFQ05_03230 [Candidatus Eisenbacteria bacterium]|nr:hypothetical protein [Candidatus Eisenbacteria bacterium]
MFTTATLMGCLRPVLQWTRARLAVDTSAALRAFQRVVAIEPCRVPAPVPIPLPRRPRAFSAMMVGALALVATLPNVSQAQAWHGDNDSWQGNRNRGFEFAADGRLVDVQVQVEGMGTVPLYTANGRFDRRYFQAFKGRNYSLVVRNNTNRRVGVLLAVDGLNAINGQKSRLSRNESMYVLDPFESTVIKGWRTSMDRVRRFVFVDEERSYAERVGKANGDMGWIRVLAFREQRPYWDVPGRIRSQEPDEFEGRGEEAPRDLQGLDRAPSPSNRSYADEQSNPGTGWGNSQRDPVSRTHFLAEASPVDHVILRYEYASGLRALGIRIWNGRNRTWERERGELGFAAPPNW